MTPENILLIKNAALMLAAFFGAVMGVLELFERAYDEKDKKIKETRKWFLQKLDIIQSSRVLYIPVLVISFGLRLMSNLGAAQNYLMILVKKRSPALSAAFLKIVFLAISVLLFGVILNADFKHLEAFRILFLLLILSIAFFIKKAADWGEVDLVGQVDTINPLFVIFTTVTVITVTTACFYVDVISATIIFIIFSPLFIAFAMIFFYFISEMIYAISGVNIFGKTAQFSFAVGISFSVTFSALAIGHYASPEEWVPQIPGILMSNVIFDGLTLIATIRLLRWAIYRSPTIRIPLAILFDAILAAMFACMSLFIGLVFTRHALTLSQVINVLFFYDVIGESIDIGPLFWVMHTTFLPTVIYLGVILFCWALKVLIFMIAWTFGQASISNHPFRVCAGALCALSLVFGFIGVTAQSSYDIASFYAGNHNGTISDKATAIDGGTLVIRKSVIELHDVRYVHIDEKCTRDDMVWACGHEANRVLRYLVTGKTIKCESRKKSRHGNIVAKCRVGDFDLAEILIREGWAVPDSKENGEYRIAENEAKIQRRGVWAGTPPNSFLK